MTLARKSAKADQQAKEGELVANLEGRTRLKSSRPKELWHEFVFRLWLALLQGFLKKARLGCVILCMQGHIT